MTVIELDAKETAKFVRQRLKDIWPKVKFSVKSAWGKIDVSWEDGPESGEVNHALNDFVGILKDEWGGLNHQKTYFNGKHYQFKVQYLFTHRSFSVEYLTAVRDYAIKHYIVEPEDGVIEVSAGGEYTNPHICRTNVQIAGESGEDFIHRLARKYCADIFMKTIKSPAARLRLYADGLQKQIDKKRAPRKTNTAKRRREAESALKDALNLEKFQDKLRALAKLWDEDRVPLELKLVSTKKEMEYLALRTYHQLPRADSDDFKMLAKVGLGGSNNYSTAIQEIQAMGDPNAGEMTTEDKIEAKRREILSRGKIEGFFPTPDSIIQKMLARARIRPGDRVLEPSAGWGNIADGIYKVHDDVILHTIEIRQSLREMLELKGHTVVAQDCLEYTPFETYDVILMNPPFENGQDAEHIMHCFEHCLAKGGRLIAVCSAGLEYRSDKKTRAFRDWLDDYGYFEPLPENAFMENTNITTGVSTRLVVLDKPGNRDAIQESEETSEEEHPLCLVYPQFHGKRLYSTRYKRYGWYVKTIALGFIVVEEEPNGYQVTWDGRETEVAKHQTLEYEPPYYDLEPKIGEYCYNVRLDREGRVVGTHHIRKYQVATDQGSIEEWDQRDLKLHRNQELLLIHGKPRLERIRTLNVINEELKEVTEETKRASEKVWGHLGKLYPDTVKPVRPLINVWELVQDEPHLLDEETLRISETEMSKLSSYAHHLHMPFFKHESKITFPMPADLCSRLLRRAQHHRGAAMYTIDVLNNEIRFGMSPVWKSGARAIAKACLESVTELDLSRHDFWRWKQYTSIIKGKRFETLKECRENRPKFYRNGKEIPMSEAIHAYGQYLHETFGLTVGGRVEYMDELWVVLSYRIHNMRKVRIQSLQTGNIRAVERREVTIARRHCRQCLRFDNLILDELADVTQGKDLCWDCLSKPINTQQNGDKEQLSLWGDDQ